MTHDQVGYEQQPVPASAEIEISPEERTLEGYLEIEGVYESLQYAIALDYERLHPDAPVTGIDKFLPASFETDNPPFWRDQLPHDDSVAEGQRWNEYTSQYSLGMRINLQALLPLRAKLRLLAEDPVLSGRVRERHQMDAEIVLAAEQYMQSTADLQTLDIEVRQIRHEASASGRGLTLAESTYVNETLAKRRGSIIETRDRLVPTDDWPYELFKRETHRLEDLRHRNELQSGLVLTESMERIIESVGPSLLNGEPLLLVGETGGAKTALALYLARKYLGKEPEFLAGYGQVNAYQVMGRMVLERGNDIDPAQLFADGALRTAIAAEGIAWDSLDPLAKAVMLASKMVNGHSVSRFDPGSLVRAMEWGVPYIVDEFTTMIPEVLKIYNTVLTLRPGDSYNIAEDGGRRITIQPGFVLIATANEKGRYKGVDSLSPELKNRFTNVVRVHYPDYGLQPGELPVENATIALAAVTDRRGELLPTIDAQELGRFVEACKVTQDLFVGHYGNGYAQRYSIDNGDVARGAPALRQEVLNPRLMVKLLQRAAASEQSLDGILRMHVDSMEQQSDRRQMLFVLKHHGFLKDLSR